MLVPTESEHAKSYWLNLQAKKAVEIAEKAIPEEIEHLERVLRYEIHEVFIRNPSRMKSVKYLRFLISLMLRLCVAYSRSK